MLGRALVVFGLIGVVTSACSPAEGEGEDIGESESLVTSSDAPKELEANGSRWTVSADALKLRKDTKEKNVDFSTLPVTYLLPQGTEVELACVVNRTSDDQCASATYYRVKVTKAKGKVPAGAIGYVAGRYLQRVGKPTDRKATDKAKLVCRYVTATGTAEAQVGDCRSVDELETICVEDKGAARWVQLEAGKHECVRRTGEADKSACGKAVVNNACDADASKQLRESCARAGGKAEDDRSTPEPGGFGTIACRCTC